MITLFKRFFSLSLCFAYLSGCAISPGMKTPEGSWLGSQIIYLEGQNKDPIKIVEISSLVLNPEREGFANEEYKISSGDKLTFTIWGQPEAFPNLTSGSLNDPRDTRTVGADGFIFFPFIGRVQVENLTINQTREKVTFLLSENFIDPQVDITITHYNSSRNVYVVGEITSPSTLVLGIEPLSLGEAIVMSGGLRSDTSEPGSVYVIRQASENNGPEVYRANLTSSQDFIVAGSFYLKPKDIIFVGAADITRWNRVISQFFPFASFINQIDNIQED
tara:strand:- start:2622 stop:3449 length:828 start_codon:yes stop_codon:yes gene_type:complete